MLNAKDSSGNRLDFFGDRIGELIRRNGRLHRHHFHHVALDLDLAGHKGLHGNSLILFDEEGLSRLVVRGDGRVRVVEFAEFEPQSTRRGVEEGIDCIFVKRHLKNCQVDLDRRGNLRDLIGVFLANAPRCIYPFVAQKSMRHGCNDSPHPQWSVVVRVVT